MAALPSACFLVTFVQNNRLVQIRRAFRRRKPLQTNNESNETYQPTCSININNHRLIHDRRAFRQRKPRQIKQKLLPYWLTCSFTIWNGRDVTKLLIISTWDAWPFSEDPLTYNTHNHQSSVIRLQQRPPRQALVAQQPHRRQPHLTHVDPANIQRTQPESSTCNTGRRGKHCNGGTAGASP